MAVYRFEKHTPEIDPSAYIAESALVIGNVKIGAECYIGHGAILRGDYGAIEVGDGSAIEEGTIIHARPDDKAVIGKSVTVGHGVMLHNCYLGDFSVIGMRATVSDYARVGKWTIIGEMSLVKNSQEIPDMTVAVGVPARVVGEVNERHQVIWNYGKDLYREMARRYKAPGAFERIDFEE